MSTAPTPPPATPTPPSLGWIARLPRWARPRATPPGGDPAGRDVRSIETILVLGVGLVLAAAVVWDVARQVRVNRREDIDKKTWVAYTHKQAKNLSIRLLQRGTTDFVCSPPTSRLPRQCLMVAGATRGGLRTVQGGYYVPAQRDDRYSVRYGCFGVPARRHLCGARGPA